MAATITPSGLPTPTQSMSLSPWALKFEVIADTLFPAKRAFLRVFEPPDVLNWITPLETFPIIDAVSKRVVTSRKFPEDAVRFATFPIMEKWLFADIPPLMAIPWVQF